MNTTPQFQFPPPPATGRKHGAILIIVMWIAFGLVSLALYFGHSMVHELRAADNRVAGAEAEQAIEGAARYISFVLSNHPGRMPDRRDYLYQDVPVGDATFWIIGRSDTVSATKTSANDPTYGLTDENGKLYLNNCTYSNLYSLPRMTDNLVNSILNWRDKSNITNGTTSSGATDQTYSSLNYTLKGSNFETTAELRFVYGLDNDILFGRDPNLNGIIDYNEKNLQVPTGFDANGATVENGLLEYVTVYSKDLNMQSNSTARVNVTNTSELATTVSQYITDSKVLSALTNLPPNAPAPTSLLQYYVQNINNGLKEADFEKIYDYITVSNGTVLGMINVNTASRVVLESLDGMTQDVVEKLISYRTSNPDNIKSIAWVATALSITSVNDLPKCHAKLTTHTYQVSADIVALGHHDRGYRRVRFVFDTSSGVPQIVYRQDLSHLGWALGRDLRDQILNSKELR